MPQHAPLLLSAVSHQSRALTNFGKPGRDRLHSASLRAVKQPTWSCSVISPCQKQPCMTSCWKVKEQWCRGTGRLDTLFSPYWRRLVESVQKLVLARPPPPPHPSFCVFSLFCSPINKSLCKAVRVRLHWGEWVCGSFSISCVIMTCSMMAEVIKNTPKRTCSGLTAVVSSDYEHLCQFSCETLMTVSLSVLAQRRDADMSVPNKSAHLLFLPSSYCSF